MQVHLFYTFLAIYVATSLITLLGITEIISIRDNYLTPLVGAFLIESAGAVIALFKRADFFSSPTSEANPTNVDTKRNQAQLVSNNAPLPSYPVEIEAAHYGSDPFQVDVTQKVRDCVHKGQLNVLVTTEELCDGRDPHPKQKKELIITCRLAGQSRTFFVPEGRRFILP